VDVTASFSDDQNCSLTVNGLFTVVHVCSIDLLAVGAQSACDPQTNTYTQEVIVTYTNAPATNLDVNGQSFAITGSPQTVTLTGLVADGQPVDVTASFSDDSNCALTSNGLFTAPVDCSAVTGAPIIDIWYGDTQEFGNNGEPQVWCNIQGNVSDSDGGIIATFEYTLNSGPAVTLSIGGDGRRLLSSGDFTVDLTVTDLIPGANTVEITAIDNEGKTTVKTVTVNYTPGNIWPIPYNLNWSDLNNDITKINEYAHVVDGDWYLTSDGIRTQAPGYDRLIAIGDRTWTNYEVLVPVTIHNMPGGAGVGVLLRWKGHTDSSCYLCTAKMWMATSWRHCLVPSRISFSSSREIT
jgi:hypothetical protein